MSERSMAELWVFLSGILVREFLNLRSTREVRIMKTFRRVFSAVGSCALAATLALMLLAALALTNVGTTPVLASLPSGDKVDKPDKPADKGNKEPGARERPDKGTSGGTKVAGDPKGNVA